jgi:hypothetical protein
MATRNNHIQRHLRENASDCLKHNVWVHVERIDPANQVAFCTVQQHYSGAVRRERSTDDLAWRAQQALSPLLELGISPQITVRQPEHSILGGKDIRRDIPSLISLVPELLRWLGWPGLRFGYAPLPLVRDPFGWRQALRANRNH